MKEIEGDTIIAHNYSTSYAKFLDSVKAVSCKQSTKPENIILEQQAVGKKQKKTKKIEDTSGYRT